MSTWILGSVIAAVVIWIAGKWAYKKLSPTSQTEQRKCPHCGATYEEGQYYCPECGEVVDHKSQRR